MNRILVAMEREADLLKIPCDIIGIKATDMPAVSDDDIIINIGFCGGHGIKVGTVVEPSSAIDPSLADGITLTRRFPEVPKAICYTCDEFVEKPLVNIRSIYDMELYRLLTQYNPKNVYSLKIVSDNLDEADCEAYNEEEPWTQVREILKNHDLI